MHAVRIYLMGRGVDIWRHLCTRCLKALEAEGWEQRAGKDPPHDLKCDGDACRAARRSEPPKRNEEPNVHQA